jgi:hypothetical protein
MAMAVSHQKPVQPQTGSTTNDTKGTKVLLTDSLRVLCVLGGYSPNEAGITNPALTL